MQAMASRLLVRRFAALIAALSLGLGGVPSALAATAQDTSPVIHELPPLPEGRLGPAVRPIAYRLDLTVDPAQPHFAGRVEIDIEIDQPGEVMFLHGRDLAVRSVELRDAGGTRTGRWHQASADGVAVLTFAVAPAKGPATLIFDYEGTFNDRPSGMFRVNVDGAWHSWTQLQSIDARAVFPAFDQPDFKTPFEVTLRTPPGLMAISNAPELSVTSERGLDVHRFAPTLPLPTYLVAMMVGPFVALEGEAPPNALRRETLPLRIVSTRQNRDQLSFALEGTKRIVNLLEDYFGDAFPFPKLDQITSPIMPGAMENAGADLYADRLLVMDEMASPSRQRGFGMVVSHELAHQWFGDLVTPAWWDDIWLNESFANWMGYRIGNAWRPDLNVAAGALASGFGAMQLDSLVAGRPIRQPIEKNSGINAAFDSITYGKGGHVIAMFAAFMGDEAFRNGVRRYLAAHRYASATSEDFFAALAGSAGDPAIVPAFKSFVEQQGVPLIDFRRNGRQFSISQSRYAPLGVVAPDTRWIVPVCLRRGNARQCRMLADREATIEIGGSGPLVPNAGGTGYYRFELPPELWSQLIDRAHKLPGGEAQAVADSLAASVMAGRSEASQLVRLARRLVRHPDAIAADAAAGSLEAIVDSGMAGPSGKDAWERLSGRTYAPLLKQYGFDPRNGAYATEIPERTQRRAQIVGRLLWTRKGAQLRSQLSAAIEAFFAGDAAALDPAWFGLAFDLHLRPGGDKAARQLLERALASEDPVFRPEAIAAVARSGDAATAKWLLEDFKDERLRKGEHMAFLRGVMARSSTRDYGYDWILSNLDELLDGKGGIFVSARLPQLFDDFCSLERAERMARELTGRFAGTPGALELERAIEKVRNCGLAREGLGSAIAASLEKFR